MPTVRMDGVEHHLGRRIAIARRKAGLTQEMLGNSLNCSFQQVQKYEKGTNRISASALMRIGTLTDVPISWFFKGLDHEDAVPSDIEWSRLDPAILQGLDKLHGTPLGTSLHNLVLEVARLKHDARDGAPGRDRTSTP